MANFMTVIVFVIAMTIAMLAHDLWWAPYAQNDREATVGIAAADG